LSLSKVAPEVVHRGDLIFGNPILLRLFEMVWFPGVAAGDIYLHPVARAAWVGLLATALNLLPIGQLDGGHILYSFVGEKMRLLSRIFVALLLLLGGYQLAMTHLHEGGNWVVFGLLVFFFGMRHPVIYDPYPIGRTRTWLGIAALLIFILSFTVSPVRANGL